MDIQSLKIFVTLAERLHFRATSEVHHMTTSALSRAIQRLEAELGCTLFERTKRMVKLTEEGNTLYAFAQHTLAAYEQLQNEVQIQTPGQLKGAIKLYSTVTAAYSILPTLIKKFRDRYPLVMTYLETGVAKNGYARLSSGEADFAIGIMTKDLHTEYLCKKVLETPLIFVVPKVPGQKRRGIQDWPLIFPEKGDLATLIATYLEKQKIQLQVHSYVEGHEAILAMVAAGLGAAILPEVVIENSHLKKAIDIVKLKHKLPSLDVGVFAKKTKLSTPAKLAFWEFLKS